jgi:hypothetical protein
VQDGGQFVPFLFRFRTQMIRSNSGSSPLRLRWPGRPSASSITLGFGAGPLCPMSEPFLERRRIPNPLPRSSQSVVLDVPLHCPLRRVESGHPLRQNLARALFG